MTAVCLSFGCLRAFFAATAFRLTTRAGGTKHSLASVRLLHDSKAERFAFVRREKPSTVWTTTIKYMLANARGCFRPTRHNVLADKARI